MKIQLGFITESKELEISRAASDAIAGIPERKTVLRNRVRRWGWDYENPAKWMGDIPSWIPAMPDSDSVTLNEYVRGQIIAPHIDSPAFGDVAILSLLADATMRFVSPMGKIQDFVLPRRSLAVMSGELRTDWTHETLPLEADRRYSVVYRKRIK